MSKHTPGPWKADKDQWVLDSEGKPFINLNTQWRSKEEIFATRDLIAAAPHLLEALKGMQCGCVAGCNRCDLQKYAIARAEGRES